MGGEGVVSSCPLTVSDGLMAWEEKEAKRSSVVEHHGGWSFGSGVGGAALEGDKGSSCD
jgi:hypothetical protein